MGQARRRAFRNVIFNGNFLSSARHGVHRVARELLRAVDARISADPGLRRGRDWRIAIPRNARYVPETSSIRCDLTGRSTWQVWEQLELPLLHRDDLIVNLCNLAPLAKPGVALLHDAQVFITPESYSRVFRDWHRYVMTSVGRRAQAVATVSHYSRRMLDQHGVVGQADVHVLHNGADHILRDPPDGGVLTRLGLEGGRYVCALSNLRAHKNIGVLLQAFSAAELQGVTLLLIGEPTAEDFTRAGFTAPARVVWSGAVTDGELRALYESAVCLAMPSTTEGFGLPPLEAMRVGCTAVVTACGALPEVCGDAAVYADPDDPRTWVHAISGLIATPEQDLARRRRAVHRASSFTWNAGADKLLKIIHEVI